MQYTKTKAQQTMGVLCTNIRWSWHSRHPVSGAIVVHVWKHPNWEKRLDNALWVLIAYNGKLRSSHLGAAPLYNAVNSGAPLFVIFNHPTKSSKKLMDKYSPYSLPDGTVLHGSHFAGFVYPVDFESSFLDEHGHRWARVHPGFMTLEAFNREQSAKAVAV